MRQINWKNCWNEGWRRWEATGREVEGYLGAVAFALSICTKQGNCPPSDSLLPSLSPGPILTLCHQHQRLIFNRGLVYLVFVMPPSYPIPYPNPVRFWELFSNAFKSNYWQRSPPKVGNKSFIGNLQGMRREDAALAGHTSIFIYRYSQWLLHDQTQQFYLLIINHSSWKKGSQYLPNLLCHTCNLNQEKNSKYHSIFRDN